MDVHIGNIIIGDGKVGLIDFGRSFDKSAEPDKNIEAAKVFDLRRLEEIRQVLLDDGFLSPRGTTPPDSSSGFQMAGRASRLSSLSPQAKDRSGPSDTEEFKFPPLYRWKGGAPPDLLARLNGTLRAWFVDPFLSEVDVLLSSIQPVSKDEREFDAYVRRETGTSLARLEWERQGELLHRLSESYLEENPSLKSRVEIHEMLLRIMGKALDKPSAHTSPPPTNDVFGTQDENHLNHFLFDHTGKDLQRLKAEGDQNRLKYLVDRFLEQYPYVNKAMLNGHVEDLAAVRPWSRDIPAPIPAVRRVGSERELNEELKKAGIEPGEARIVREKGRLIGYRLDSKNRVDFRVDTKEQAISLAFKLAGLNTESPVRVFEDEDMRLGKYVAYPGAVGKAEVHVHASDLTGHSDEAVKGDLNAMQPHVNYDNGKKGPDERKGHILFTPTDN
jgi:hypothetical protein